MNTTYQHNGYSNTLAELNTRSEIREIQSFLIQNGYNLGRAGADGILGRRTKQAIYDFFGTQFNGGNATPSNNTTPSSPSQPSQNPSATLDVATMRSIRFRNSTDINTFFVRITGQDFVDFFRRKVGGKSHWVSRRGNAVNIRSGSKAQFNAVFDQIPTLYNMPSINLFQFLGLVSCMINETRSFKPIRESFWVSLLGRLKYAYGTNGGRKRSYNDSPNAKSVHTLINNADFIRAHSSPNVRLSHLRRFNWRGSTFPNVRLNNDELDLICQCDVYKFSGLGLIQTTWRPAYKRIIEYVMSYSGTNPKINNVKMNWRTFGNTDKIADLSKYQEWEYLFEEPHIAAKAVYLHSVRTGYLNFNITGASYSTMLDRAANIGYRIGGNSRYRTKVRHRVDQIIKAMQRL